MALQAMPSHVLMLDGVCHGFQPSKDGSTVAVSRWELGHSEFVLKNSVEFPVNQGRVQYLELLTQGARKV